MTAAISPTKESVLQLKTILERENGRAFTLEEAERIGRGLLNIYGYLADSTPSKRQSDNIAKDTA